MYIHSLLQNHEFTAVPVNELLRKELLRLDKNELQYKLNQYPTEVRINDKVCNFKNSTKELLLFEGFKKGKNTVRFEYIATPKQTMYFVGEGENLQIWTQGQGKYTSHWFPSFDDMNEKVIFNMTIISNKNFEVISNGLYSSFDNRKGNQISFNSNGTDKASFFTMKKPMSSYLLMLAIGKFEKQTIISASGTLIENYISPEDVSKFEPTYRYTKQIFDFFEKEIGVNYPWEIYRQIPAKDFLYGGKLQRVERQLHHYGSGLNAIPVLTAYRRNPDDLHLLRVGYGGLLGAIANITEDGFGPAAFHAFPATLKIDGLSGDYGPNFYGYAVNSATYLVNDPKYGWLSFGGNLTETAPEIKVIINTAAAAKLFIAPAKLWITLPAGKIESFTYNKQTSEVTLTLAPKTEFTDQARLQLEATDQAYEIVGKYALERNATVIPLKSTPVVVKLKLTK
ncbi:MAG: hypothetical protein EOO07_25855 [Chitinophagaceae bacterium]|nr:MAG: hypothetical protein EOO07_25855 [Chitinophagaceae bacterium]